MPQGAEFEQTVIHSEVIPQALPTVRHTVIQFLPAGILHLKPLAVVLCPEISALLSLVLQLYVSAPAAVVVNVTSLFELGEVEVMYNVGEDLHGAATLMV